MTEETFTRKPGTERFTTLEPVPMAYPHVVVPHVFKRAGKPTGDPFYSGDFCFKPDSEELKQIKAIWQRLCEESFPGRLAREAGERKAAKAAGLPAPTNHLRFPIQDGTALANEDKKKEFLRGFAVISAKAYGDRAPRLSGFANGAMVNYDDDAKKAHEKEFYAGVEVLVQFYFKTYEGTGKGENKGRDGIAARLNMVFTTNKGKKFPTGSGPNPAEVFKGYQGKPSPEDPTAGQFDDNGDDDIPF